MKKLFISIFAVIFISAIIILPISCKKETVVQSTPCPTPVPCPVCPTPTYPIGGLWIGTYTVDQLPSQPAYHASLAIYPDGTVVAKGQGATGAYGYAAGTWTLSTSNILTTTVTTIGTGGQPITSVGTFTYSNTGTLTNGTWRETINPYGPLTGKYSTFQRIN